MRPFAVALFVSLIAVGSAGAQQSKEAEKAHEKIQQTNEKAREKELKAEHPGTVQSEKELAKAREAREKALEKDRKIENKAITKASRRRSSSTGRCNDGVYTSVRVRSQACRRDGGVREWYR